jgi:predicted extracellular nuclease
MRTASNVRFAIALLAMLAMAGVAAAASPNILISEFRTRGPAGGNDEFVEIWNNSGLAINLSGYTLRGSNNAAGTSQRAIVPAGTILNAGCYYLFTNATATGGYSGSVPGNTTFTVGITDDGGIAILNAAAVIVDQVGMSAGSAYKEGTTLAPTLTNLNQSYERKPGGGSGNSLDTDNNLNDFLYHNASSDPQNGSSLCLGATPTRKDTWGSVKTIYR